ncbi:hypothetical protein FDB44_12235 [Clostridium botulinum]|uniref:hypothetical protein n=1 Tax=Clostridium botulinum TaxID=1491 RepID=UPI0006941993|nr:hypothetical protein [Clostridium botulinum]MBY6934390.1 hypothetical protein [Clostridium botulinum]NFL83355.1 hypothetical protein [Clostridium botulinum]NFN12203.1 hypothetical protein [Clostridium botulinum]NFO37630.1 hypothetical protein [Clostridium botulinum]NFO43927.1 hypothetical protein [Clostridium botulinum]
MSITYTQDIKNRARRMMLQHAVKSLTIDRNSTSCVDNYYVRNIYNYFLSLDEGHDYDEARKIDLDYIVEWERQWAVQIGSKKPENLTVCYLSGPEPQNDFNELISLGILPQNIWAFEMNRGIYTQALGSYDTSNFKQPKIVKMSIEKFFECIPKKFDIVYIDACGSLISDKHALRCISTLFKYHRLNSPGMLLTNFAEIEAANYTERSIYVDIMSKYFLLKQNPNANLIDDEKAFFKEINQSKLNQLHDNFDYYYGELITSLICDIASVTVPNLRFANSRYWSDFIDVIPPLCDYISIRDVNTIKNNSGYKFFLCNKLFKNFNSTDIGISKINKLASEMAGITPQNIDLLRSMRIIENIKNGDNIRGDIKELFEYFDSGSMYQFLDKPSKNMFLDLTINQLSYPMHYVSHSAKRISYRAKETKMFMDAMIFDECRYIYEWLPAIHQIKNAFQNLSWQYVFRFAVDGLVKQRFNYNNEFFFQGSVISKEIDGFKEQCIKEREYIGG